MPVSMRSDAYEESSSANNSNLRVLRPAEMPGAARTFKLDSDGANAPENNDDPADREPTSDLLIGFVRGTRIATPDGERFVEELQPGDEVLDAEGRETHIAWIGCRRISFRELLDNPQLRPVRILAQALGPGCPARDILVSPHHRICLRGHRLELMFESPDVLVPAISLVDGERITHEMPESDLTYYHVLLADDELIWSEGMLSASQQPSCVAVMSMPVAERSALRTLFPGLVEGTAEHRANSLPTLRHFETNVALSCLESQSGGISPSFLAAWKSASNTAKSSAAMAARIPAISI